jgi:hypothetical protein
MSWKLRESFVGHPSAILFLRISGERLFQQPEALALIDWRDQDALISLSVVGNCQVDSIVFPQYAYPPIAVLTIPA